MLRITSFLLLMMLLISCSNQKQTTSKKISSKNLGLPSTIVLGTSTEGEVVKQLGEPNFSYSSKDNSQTKIYDYKDLGSLKFDASTLKAFFRKPNEQESILQYWLQKWVQKKIQVEKLKSSHAADGTSEFQMICIEDKTTIIYEGETGVVTRVIHYEK